MSSFYSSHRFPNVSTFNIIWAIFYALFPERNLFLTNYGNGNVEG